MKLLLSNNSLTRYSNAGAYATTTAIPLDGDLATTAQALLAWLQAQLVEGESVGQVFLEPDGTHSEYETTVDAEGIESQVATATRAKLSAAVTAHAPAACAGHGQANGPHIVFVTAQVGCLCRPCRRGPLCPRQHVLIRAFSFSRASLDPVAPGNRKYWNGLSFLVCAALTSWTTVTLVLLI